jgi:pSer/pThr/pTyr-binding forkhead associated (FHA) protein
LHDTASKNGTYVNGKRISGPTRLRSGDEIRMCDQRLVFVTRDTPPDHPSPTHTLAS